MCETDLRDIKREDYERFGHPVFLLPCEKVLLGDGVPNRISEGGGLRGLRGVHLTQRLPLVYSPLPEGSNKDSQINRIQSQSHLIILSQKTISLSQLEFTLYFVLLQAERQIFVVWVPQRYYWRSTL